MSTLHVRSAQTRAASHLRWLPLTDTDDQRLSMTDQDTESQHEDRR